MSDLPSLTPKKVLRALKKADFYIHHQRGSHIYLKHPESPDLLLVVPNHPRDLKKGTLSGIIKRSGLSIEEFKGFL